MNTKLKSINELSEIYKLDLSEKFILCTLHPETNNKKANVNADSLKTPPDKVLPGNSCLASCILITLNYSICVSVGLYFLFRHIIIGSVPNGAQYVGLE